MEIKLSGETAYMTGNWTLTGVTQDKIKSLAATLPQIESSNIRKLRVDCQRLSAIDSNGRQLLEVWLQCVRFRGVEPELLNSPPELRPYLKKPEPTGSHPDKGTINSTQKTASSNSLIKGKHP